MTLKRLFRRKAVRYVVRAGLDELKKLQEAIQDLQNAIDSIKTKTECWIYKTSLVL